MSIPIVDNLIVQNGSVGIGTTTPAQKLEISGNAAANSLLKINSLEFQPYALNNSWFGENVYFNGSHFVRRQAGSAGLFYFQGSEGQFRFNASDDADTPTSDYPQFKISYDGQFGIGSSIAYSTGDFTGSNFYVAADGKVGIGTSTPASLLHVAGYSDDVNTPIQIIESTGSQAPYTFRVSNTDQAYVKGDNAGNLALGAQNFIALETGGFGGAHEAVRVLATGEVGIGTTTPNTPLDVNGVITATGGNSNQWNASYTNLIYNSASYLSGFNSTAITQNSANWNTAYTNLVYNSASYLTGASLDYVNTTFVKLSGDNMTGLLTNSVGISTTSISARFIDLIHLPANDGINPVLRIGEYDTTAGNQGFSGMYMSYNETANTFGVSGLFAPNVGVPALTIDRQSNTSIRSLYAGSLDSAFTGSFTSLSAISGMYVDPVSGYAGFMTFNPIAPVDVRGTMVRVASAGCMTSPSNLKVHGNYAYVLNYTSGSLQVFDITYSSALSTVSAGAGTQPQGLYVNGKYAYVVTYNSSSSQLLIFELGAGAPIMISSKTLGWGTYNATEVYVQGNYAYITGQNAVGPSAGRIMVWDISNPANPRAIVNTTSLGINPRGLTVQDRYVYYYTNSLGSASVYRMDVSDLLNGYNSTPSILYNISGQFYCLAVRGNYLYVESAGNLRVLDIARGTLLSTIVLANIPSGWNGEMVLQGNYLYLIRLSSLVKIDISNPVAPFVVQYIGGFSGTPSTLNPLQIQGRYAYVLDSTAPFYPIRTFDLGGAYVQQLQAGGIKTDRLYVAQNSYFGNDLDVMGGAGFGQGFKSYKDSSIQGALTLTTLSGASAVNYFSVVSGFNTTLFVINTAGNVGINTGQPNEKLTVVGNISATGTMALASTTSSSLTSNGALTVAGGVGIGENLNTGGIVNLSNITNNPSLQINGYANKGGVGYHDFMSVTNTYGSATTPNKFFRLNSSGGLEILNSQYTQALLQLTNDGALNVYAASPAVVSNNDALSGYIAFNNNSTQMYDDGNTHIHSRGSGNAMWINTNNAQLNLLTQATVNGGAVGTGVAIGTGTLNGYVSINSSRSTSITQPYGYLNSSGAGSTPGTSPNPYSLTCSSRIQCPEFNASSDERLKENIVPIHLSDATNFVRGVSAITFNWKDAENPGKKSGFIAQQVMKAGFDHLISIVGNNDVPEQIDADGFVSPASAAMVMNYDQAIPYHHEVIKNLLERIEQLEKEICELKKK